MEIPKKDSFKKEMEEIITLVKSGIEQRTQEKLRSKYGGRH